MNLFLRRFGAQCVVAIRPVQVLAAVAFAVELRVTALGLRRDLQRAGVSDRTQTTAGRQIVVLTARRLSRRREVGRRVVRGLGHSRA